MANRPYNLVLFGHSQVRRLRYLGTSVGIDPNTLIGLPQHNVTFEGYGGLNFDRVQDNPLWYLRNLINQPIDVLAVDLGCNDLCSVFVSPAVLITKVKNLMAALEANHVRPGVLVFLTQLMRTAEGGYLGVPGNVSLAEFNAKTAAFNDGLTFEFEQAWPWVTVWSQEGYNTPHYINGCHLTNQGEALQIQELNNMFVTMMQVLAANTAPPVANLPGQGGPAAH